MTKIEDRKARMAANGKTMDDRWQALQDERAAQLADKINGSIADAGEPVGYDTPEARALLATMEPPRPRPAHHVAVEDDTP